MTIAVSVKVRDGIVLASDSATTLMSTSGPIGSPVVTNVYNHANKIFNLRKGLPIGAVTFGAGSIDHASISTLAKDLRSRFQGQDPDHIDWLLDSSSYTIEEVANRAHAFLIEEMYKPIHTDPKSAPPFGFWIAGYSAGSSLSELWIIEIENGDCAAPVQRRDELAVGIDWAGQPDTISRLILGFGVQLPEILTEMGVAEADLPGAVARFQAGMEIDLCAAPMPVQDAIDLARFLAEATIMLTRFKEGAATVGGAVDVAAITKYEGFKWVSRKHYYDPALNPESDHGRH